MKRQNHWWIFGIVLVLVIAYLALIKITHESSSIVDVDLVTGKMSFFSVRIPFLQEEQPVKEPLPKPDYYRTFISGAGLASFFNSPFHGRFVIPVWEKVQISNQAVKPSIILPRMVIVLFSVFYRSSYNDSKEDPPSSVIFIFLDIHSS